MNGITFWLMGVEGFCFIKRPFLESCWLMVMCLFKQYIFKCYEGYGGYEVEIAKVW